MITINYRSVEINYNQIDFGNLTEIMANLMIRNFSTKDRIFYAATDWSKSTDKSERIESKPGCIIASPTFPCKPIPKSITDQDYVFHWVRDAAISIMELGYFKDKYTSYIEDYVDFSRLIQTNAIEAKKTNYSCFRVDGTLRDGTRKYSFLDYSEENIWNQQNDGCPLRIISLIELKSIMTQSYQDKSLEIIKQDIDTILGCYKGTTEKNIWEEVGGESFFVKSVQLEALKKVLNNNIYISEKKKIQDAIDYLTKSISKHWNDEKKHYISIINPIYDNDNQKDKVKDSIDLNSDIIMASIYGSIDVMDSQMMSSACKVLEEISKYKINEYDQRRGIGPLIGRYPNDVYDGNNADNEEDKGIPWVPCTSVLAEYFYRVAYKIKKQRSFEINDDNRGFYNLAEINDNKDFTNAIDKLIKKGDKMLQAIIYHSDHLELSEQIDPILGYEQNVKNLTWSYASFLSAVRARKRVK